MAKTNQILVLEDEPYIGESLQFLLERDGYEVKLVSHASDAYRFLAVERPRLLILDLMLPSIGGLEVLAEVRQSEQHAGLKVLVLSAKGQEQDRNHALSAGADAYMTKPFANKDLVAQVRALVEAES